MAVHVVAVLATAAAAVTEARAPAVVPSVHKHGLTMR
jgi:hypothetical protein